MDRGPPESALSVGQNLTADVENDFDECVALFCLVLLVSVASRRLQGVDGG